MKVKRKFLSLNEVREKYDVNFGCWDDYHEGDSENFMKCVKQLGYISAVEIGLVDTEEFGTGYLFAYFKHTQSLSLEAENIRVDLGIAWAEDAGLEIGEWQI